MCGRVSASRKISGGPPSGGGCLALEQPADRLAAGTRVVVRLEHLELVTLDEVLAGEEDGRHATLLDQAAQALRVDSEFAGGFDEVKVVLEWGVRHACIRSLGRWGARQSAYMYTQD